MHMPPEYPLQIFHLSKSMTGSAQIYIIQAPVCSIKCELHDLFDRLEKALFLRMQPN